VGAVGIAALTGQVLSQDPGQMKGNMPSPEEMQKMMKKMMELSQPGENHKRLDDLAGEWDVVMHMYMGGPGTPPTESKGHSKVTWVLDGRFLHDEFEGEMKMPGPDGKPVSTPFKGMGMTGYDNYRNMYVGSWADNMGTQLLTMSGSYNPNTKELSMYGAMDEPTMNVSGRLVRYVTRFISKDKHMFEMYDLHASPDYKVMEITYTRKK
jgi:hypothetical protein